MYAGVLSFPEIVGWYPTKCLTQVANLCLSDTLLFNPGIPEALVSYAHTIAILYAFSGFQDAAVVICWGNIVAPSV